MSPLEIHSTTPARILIVEDEGIIANHISSTLVKLGHEVVGIAESSEDALAKAAELGPQLVLMDIRIKGEMDGIATAAALRDRFDIPFIYLTAHTDQSTIDRAKMTGASGFLPKPLHSATLAVSIEIAIHRHRADQIQHQASIAAQRVQDRYAALAALTEGLAAGEARYRALVKATAQIVWTMTPQGTPTDLEEDWRAFTGQTGTELRQEALHPDDRPLAAEKWAEAMRTGTAYELEKRVRRRDGEYCWMLARVVPVLSPDGSILEWIGACTDISDRKRTEAEIRNLNESLEDRVSRRTAALARAVYELAQTRADLQGVLDAATQISIISTDTKGTIEIFNSGAERMLQYQACEMEGLHTPEIFHDPLECEERSLVVSRQFGRTIKGFDAIVEYARHGQSDEREWTYVRKDGSRLDVSLAITPVFNQEALLKGFLTIAADITARKSLERELRLNMEKLAEQTRRAEQASIAKSDFLATMSHEIRTPMNAILGMSDMLVDSQLDAEQTQYVEVFRRAGANLLVLINDILDLSKIEAGHLELEHVPFDLEDVVEQAIEITGVKARAKGIVLLSHLSSGVATALLGDPARLRQVLINLLGNAVNFTGAGQVLLTVRNELPGRTGQIEFAVSDTGIGIPSDKLETIFDDFTQADASTAGKYGGTGLGLGISRRLVKMMGGSLTGTSSVGAGSTFRFTAEFDLAPNMVPKVRSAQEDIHGKRVLLIDGNAISVFILRETLQAWGLKSHSFRSPDEALARLPEEMAGEAPYSLAIVDNGMLGMGGFEAAARIRRIAPALPVVMLTFDAQPGDTARGMDAGLAGYAVKPVAPVQLLRLVCDAMKTREVPELPPAGRGDDREKEPVQPARILIAEDSSDNRLLIQVYLKGSPYQLTFEENGRVAVDRFSTDSDRMPFDLILMDLRMPVMDGLAATRAIRKIERERGISTVPILALTANAGLLDIQRSAEAGCNAHLSKPISKRELLDAIEKYKRPSKPLEVALPVCSGPIRIEMPEGLEDIVPGYLAKRRNEVSEMTDLLAVADFDRLGNLGHNLKGTGASYGFPELARIGASFEHSANQSDPEALRTQLNELKDYLGQIQLFAKA